MALNNKIGDFAIIGIRSLTAFDKVTGVKEGNFENLVNINFADELAVDYLRGGYTNPKLLAIYGDRDPKFTATTATISPELLKVLTSNELIERVEESKVYVEYPELKAGGFTLEHTPTAGAKMTVCALDEFGREMSPQLVVGDPTGEDIEYSIADKVITCNSAVKSIVVYYEALTVVDSLEISEIIPKNYKYVARCVVAHIATGEKKMAWMEIPNGAVTPSYSLSGKNEASAPDAVELVIDCLMDKATGYPIKLSFE